MNWVYVLESLYDGIVAFGIVAGIYAIFVLGLNVHWGYCHGLSSKR